MLLSKESFIAKLEQVIQDQREDKKHTIRLVFKRCIEGNRNWKRAKAEQPETSNVYCLVRAKIGNVKISTKVESGGVDKFRKNLSEVIDSIPR